ncbi:hypothetical protein B0H66DRAFT_641833 [Apodospora peruviana]|uniref:NAD dependent epimerase/dehydratase n=1 Tax=Apodospora peruviana TaxID=516989 RepID=A0AAE0HXK3_9PEZI|nr:hypothetical protein B0H66DRAFT_641833 [Apodospora peruviana]
MTSPLDPFRLTPAPARVAPGKSVKIIVAGLPRTGTASLKLALETLGISPVHHFADPPNQYQRLSLAANLLKDSTPPKIRRQKLFELFDGYEAIADQPVCACLPDLLEMYPDAVVILTERASAKIWLDSFKNSVGFVQTGWWRYVGYLVPAAVSTNDIFRAWRRISAKRLGISGNADEEMYTAHGAWVRKHVAPEKLLVYRVEMGYEPLCKFLGVEVPLEGKFPRSEKSQRDTFQLYRWICMTCGASAWVAVVVLAWYFWVVGAALLVEPGRGFLEHFVRIVTE